MQFYLLCFPVIYCIFICTFPGVLIRIRLVIMLGPRVANKATVPILSSFSSHEQLYAFIY
jgi:hypothetical protein